MKLRNKKTGEIGEVGYLGDSDGKILVNNINDLDTIYEYDSLAEFNAEWEDYEEPKKFWYMTAWGDVYEYSQSQFAIKQKQAIGNYFESEEEAEKAVKKLKAWKRLKDKGFRFEGWDNTDHSTIHNFSLFVAIEDLENINKDLDLLFGGEE